MAWQRWYAGAAAQWKGFVKGAAETPRVTMIGTMVQHESFGGRLALRKWREHLLITGNRYVACVRCWKFGVKSRAMWQRGPCSFEKPSPPRSLLALFEAGEFAGLWARPCRRREEAKKRLDEAGLGLLLA